MARTLAYLLTTLILLQTFSRELVVVDYQLHKERITELFCVNKDKPKLHCNGKCHLAKKLRQATSSESKAPAGGFAKVKYDAVLPLRALVVGPAIWPAAPTRFGRLAAVSYCFSPAHSIFHPPSSQA
ncbi:hypothetical protein [Hymenobacter chitinivorans]|uniref:Uncharacterized protein n=1 Tax=Hymenobacter chitinivorans DSM 11115 TaxID=1121954 RepID=A0A2M9BMZ2_9BACT|nr:hypothetical protein [Hymenobacter chitinivorans]PJJ59328.1 hypothetical protein CLV45_0745 [Hymenobacter chitinivorans DSM 11115]